MTELLELSGRDLERELQKIIKETPPIKKPWTAKEDEILKRLREAGIPYVVIGKKLGRTRKSVENRASNLNLSGS